MADQSIDSPRVRLDFSLDGASLAVEDPHNSIGLPGHIVVTLIRDHQLNAVNVRLLDALVLFQKLHLRVVFKLELK